MGLIPLLHDSFAAFALSANIFQNHQYDVVDFFFFFFCLSPACEGSTMQNCRPVNKHHTGGDEKNAEKP